jgi:ribosomal protein L34
MMAATGQPKNRARKASGPAAMATSAGREILMQTR